MIAFQVNDMTCSHCASSVTKAVQAVDSAAAVRVDLEAHRVEIDTTRAGAAELGEAIAEAGFTPVPLA